MRRYLASLAVSALLLASLAVAGCDESSYAGYLPGGGGSYDAAFVDTGDIGGYYLDDVYYDDVGYYDGYYDGGYDYIDDGYFDYVDDSYYYTDDYYGDYYDDGGDYYDDAFVPKAKTADLRG